MSQVRLCDRCHAPAALSDAATARRSLVLAATDPSTNPVATPITITLSVVVAPQDLCPICTNAALVAYAHTMGTDLTTDVVETVTKRLTPAPPVSVTPTPVSVTPTTVGEP